MPELPDDPVSQWLHDLPAGDSLAQHQVAQKFARKVEWMANRYLKGVRSGDSDGQDVANQVLNSFFQRVEDGRLTPPSNRDQLANLLLRMAKNKSADLARRKRAQKRAFGKVRGESVFGENNSSAGMECVRDENTGPQQALVEAEQLSVILDSLNDNQLRQIALLRMAGNSNDEIAATLGCGRRTIERRVGELRSHLTAADSAD